MTTPEGKIKLKVKQALTRTESYWFCPVQSGYGNRTLDFLCCKNGRFFAVETKREGKDLTAIQTFIKRQIEEAGGKVFVVNNEEGVKELETWITSI